MQHHNRAKERRDLAAAITAAELMEREPAAGVGDITGMATGEALPEELDAELLPSDDEGEDEDGYDEETDIEDADIVDDKPVAWHHMEVAVPSPLEDWAARLKEWRAEQEAIALALRAQQLIADVHAWDSKALEHLKAGEVSALVEDLRELEKLDGRFTLPAHPRRAPEVEIAPDIAERYNVAAMMSGRFDDTAINAATAARATVDEAGPYLSALMEPFEATDENIFGAASTR